MPSYAGTAAGAPAPEALRHALEQFLLEHPHSSIVEDGKILFDMTLARWSLEGTQGRCVLQLWSEERTLARTVTALEQRKGALRLEVRRFGQTKPQVLRLVPSRDPDQRTPSARETSRRRYVQILSRVLARCFPELQQTATYTSADLERSFGPACVRGLLERGQTAWAFVGVDQHESQASVDGALTVAMLWLAHCRERSGGRRVVEGVRVFLPAGMAGTVRERMQWVHPAAAKWELYTLDAATEELEAVTPGDSGNQRSRLVHAFAQATVLARSQASIERVLALVPVEGRERVEALARSTTEVSLRLHGLEFARVRHGVSATSFAREDHITFGTAANETPLNAETEPMLRELVERLFASRRAGGSLRDPLYRLQPEQWLEANLRHDLAELEPSLLAAPVYTQVPALAGADRGMLDLLAVTRDGRLAVLELKASEDMHMPVQGLDYWMRVRALHAAGEIAAAGYFPGVVLSDQPPLLYFIVPALHLHPTFDTVTRHLAPQVEWRLLALDEQWRKLRRVIFRKHGGGERPWPRVLPG